MKAQKKALKLQRKSHFSYVNPQNLTFTGTTVSDPTTATATTILTTHIFNKS
jgi:hypothetical protein